MSELWYFSLEGEVYGPVETVDLQNLLKQGEVKSQTMVLKEGAENWQPLGEAKELSLGNENTYLGERTRPQTFVLEPLERESAELSVSKPFLGTDEVTVTQHGPHVDEAKWVILKGVKEGDKERFLQEGPYSTAEILAKLKSGEIRYADHCWRDGMGEWRALRDEPIFAGLPDDEAKSAVRLTPAGETDIEIPEALPLEDIGSVQFSSTEVHSMALEEPVPPEAGGEDLTSEDKEFNFTEDSAIFANPLQVPETEKTGSEVSSPFLKKQSAVIELEEREKSVTKAPISSPLDDIKKPASMFTPDSQQEVMVQQVGAAQQPHVRQKLLEAQMEQGRTRPRSSSSMTRLFILLAGALMLLIFGLQLAKDLAH